MPDAGDKQPKIIIDEDWKTQVQAEKEALSKVQAEQPSTGQQQQPASAKRSGSLPTASLTILISMLATQATISLGAVEHPATGKAEPDLDEARHLIDLLQVLEDKTKGNRTPQESAVLTRILDELRLGYLTVQNSSANPAEAKAT